MSPSRLVPALVAAASLALLAGAVAFAVAGPGDDAPAGAAEPGIAPGGGSSGSIGAPGSVGAPDAAVGEARSLPVVTSDPPVPHGGDGSAPPRGITVTGTAIVEGTADESEWSFGVQAQADDARTALAEAAEAANRLVAALRREGVAERDMRTENVSVWPTHDERGGVSGYTASTSVRTLVRDLARAGRVVDAAVAAGANQVSGPSFSASA